MEKKFPNGCNPEDEECIEGVSAVAPTNNPPSRGANFTEMVETLEENEDEVECKECFCLAPKAECTKDERGYICPTCGKGLKVEKPEINTEFDYYESEFPEVETYDAEFADRVKSSQDRFDFDADFADGLEECGDVEPSDEEEIEPELLTEAKKWTCYYDNKEIGTVEAKTEEEAYAEMERQFPEHDYGAYDGVAAVSLVESAEALTEAPGDGAAYNTSRKVSALADKAASWARLKVGGDNSIIDYFFGDISLFRAIDEEAGKAKGKGFSVVAIAEGFARGGAGGEAATNANAAIAKANKSGKGNSFGKIDEAIAVAKTVSTRHTEVIVTITIESFSDALQSKIKAEYPKLLNVIKGKSSSFVRGGSTTPPILEFSKGKSTPKAIDINLRNTLRDIKADIEQSFTYEDFALTEVSGDKDPEQEDPKPTGKGWKCPVCSEMNDPEDKVCGECGNKKPVEKPSTSGDSWECPECGKKNTKKFCSECGSKKPEVTATSADSAKVRQLKNKLTDLIDEAIERLEDENPEEDGLRDKYFDRCLKHLDKLSDRVVAAETVEELEDLDIETAIEKLFDTLAAVEGRGNKPAEEPEKEEETPAENETSEEEASEESSEEETPEEETPNESEEETENEPVGPEFTGKLSDLSDIQLAKLYSAVSNKAVGYADKEKTKLADKWHKIMNKLRRNLQGLGESFETEEALKESIKEVLSDHSFENELDEYHADQQFIDADNWEDAWAEDWSENADLEQEPTEEIVECSWCLNSVPKSICRKEVDLGWLCDHCEEAIKSRGEPLTFEEKLDLDIDLSGCVDSSDIEVYGLEPAGENTYKAVLAKRYENVSFRDLEAEPAIIDEMREDGNVFEFSFDREGNPELHSWNVDVLRKLGPCNIIFEDERYDKAANDVFSRSSKK